MIQKTQEIWKPIKNYEGFYEVSNLGRVKSITKNRHYGHKTHRICFCKPNIIKSGYCYAHLYKNGPLTRTTIAIHRLVADAFLPNPDNKPDVNHVDGNKTNNHMNNLQWVTKSENTRHAFRTGLMTSEMYSKLTKEEVQKIKELYPIKTQHELATMFNISQTQISRIINKICWAYGH